MSTLSVGTISASTTISSTNIVASTLKHSSASSNNITLNSDSSVTLGNVTASTTTVSNLVLSGTAANNRITFADGTILSKSPRIIFAYDTRSGCPPTQAADTDIMSGTFTLDRPSTVLWMYDSIGNHTSRFDTYLIVNGTSRRRTLTSQTNAAWKPVHILYGNEFAAGTITWNIRCNVANVIGCGSDWGSMTIMIIEK